MKGYLDKLRPMERRLVIGVLVGVFALLNVVLVLPHRHDLADMQDRLQKARRKLARFEKEIAQVPDYEKKIKTIGKGLDVPAEEQRTAFTDAIVRQGGESRVTLFTPNRMSSTTNQFFVEQSQSIRVQSGEDQLVDFLYHLGSGASLIRVRGLVVYPDQPRQNLSADVTLVASYQKALPQKGKGSASAAAPIASTREP